MRLANSFTLVATVFMTAAMTSSARASFVSAYSGNTQPYNANSIDHVGGTINFAVYDRTTGGTAGDTFGTGLAGFDALFTAASGSGAFDTTARYLYLYQTVNNGPASASTGIFENTVFITRSLITSGGSFAGTSFGTTVLGTAAGFGNPSPASVGATPTVILEAGNTTPSQVTIGSTSLQSFYYSDLGPGAKSILWGDTSNSAPDFHSTAIIEAGGANGTAPSATVPEPTSLMLAGIGAALCLGAARRHGKAVV